MVSLDKSTEEVTINMAPLNYIRCTIPKRMANLNVNMKRFNFFEIISNF
jgi:hypothetical protein